MVSSALIEAVTRFAGERPGDGPFLTGIDGLFVLRNDHEKPPSHVIHRPALCVVVQGAKWSEAGDVRLHYGAGQALLVSLDIPATGCVVEASPAKPFLGVVLELDLAILRDVIEQMATPPSVAEASLGLAVISILIGAAIGLVTAFALTAKNRFASAPARIYVTVIRNLPILVLVLFAYFALPQMGFRIGKIQSFVAVLSIYSGAYLAEVFRAGLLSIPRGLTEAGLAIGLTPMQIRGSIIAPLMFRNVLPSLSSTVISLFKDTSLAAAIAVPELTFAARKINVESFRVIETWMVTSALYVVTCFLIAAIMRFVERRLALPR